MKSRMRPIGALVLALLAAGCATEKTITISTKPADATIKIDGIDKGRAPLTEKFVFANEKEVHRVTASRLGFRDQTVQVGREFAKKDMQIELRPQSRKVYFSVAPVPGVVVVDGKPLSPELVGAISAELEFTVDANNNWTTHRVSAERPGWNPATQTVSWTDTDQNYVLRLQPMRKSITVTTKPPGAQVFLDGQLIGTSPATDADRDFPVDVDTGQVIPRKLRAERAGFDPVEMEIGWDDGRSDYHIDLAAKRKTVRIAVDPEDATIAIEGASARRAAGAMLFDLQFPPINERGDLQKYKALVTKKTADSEWYPAEIEIGWDGGKNDYAVQLKEILTRPVPLVSAVMQRGESGWEVAANEVTTIAAKDLTEGARGRAPAAILRLPAGEYLGSMSVSPDGGRLVFNVLQGKDKTDFRSVLRVIQTDGSGGTGKLTDGRTLDLTPTFTPGGDQILFSSTRAGKRLQIWSIPADGAGGVTRQTTADTHDLWPSLDSDPKPRLFYQAMVDTRDDPRMYMTQVGTVFQTDLTQLGGQQPRVSPRNDSVLFTLADGSTGKRDIYRVSDKGGAPENLTNTPDIDEFDAVWTRDGRRIAFASDRATDSEGRNNYDIWIMDLSRPGEPTQITANASVDDCPVFDPAGGSIYFRSNRGGSWGIWKIMLR